MRKFFTIGETVYDIIFENGTLKAGRPGGSVLNTSVSLGRLGADVVFISELGQDDMGGLIAAFLEGNGVSTRYIHRFENGRTPLAIAFLDADRNARYTFYKQYPAKRMQQSFPQPGSNDLVVFGSFFSLSPFVREPLVRFVKKAAKSGAIIIYDPNIRKPHQKDMPNLLPMVDENIALADIVRASDEDFRVILGIENGGDAYRYVSQLCNATLIYTRGGKDVRFYSGTKRGSYHVDSTGVVSTIGAGDNFNAGLAWSIFRDGITKYDLAGLEKAGWDKLIRTAISFGTEACKHMDNYIPLDFARKLTRE